MKKKTVFLIGITTLLAMTACSKKAEPENFFDGSDIAPDISIEGCDTFEQVVETNINSDMGYAYTTIGGEDVLLVASGCYDNLDGNMAAIDATVIAYVDDKLQEIGKVTCGGTAYPLCLKDGNLICAGNHYISEVTISDGEIKLITESWVEYGGGDDGEDVFYTYEAEGQSKTEIDEDSYWELFDVLENTEIINFEIVQ